MNLLSTFLTTKQPPVSIIMPARNAEKFIDQAINSFLKQDYKNKELIIVDDASADKTAFIAEQYVKKYSNIRLVKNKQQLGIPKTRNIALHKANGKYIGHLDADDLLKKHALKIAVKTIEKEKAALVYSGYNIIDQNNKETGKRVLARHFDRKKLHLLGWQHFGLYKKSVAMNVGGFNEKLITCSDGDLFMKIAQKYKCTRINDYLYYYRIHKHNIGHTRPECFDCTKQKVCEYFGVWNKNDI